MKLEDKISFIWFVIDGFTHMSIELGYVYLALTSTAKYSDSFLGHIWREYGRADARWAVRDPNVISLELLTVFLVGPLCFLQAYGILRKSSWRYVLQVIICTAELYGGWMTFAPEWVEGSPNLNGSTFDLLWIYLVFMNGLWVIVPLLLLWEGVAYIVHACKMTFNDKKAIKEIPSAPSTLMFILVSATIVLYCVLVPYVLFKAEGVPVSVKP